LLEYDGVQLEFEPDALNAIAQEAVKRNTGARGLRAIVEQAMLDVMYDLPGDTTIKKCIVTKDTITKGEKPVLMHGEKRETA
jgi:ATP-dependent Clp protease ATP-binding subunit ClpX